MTLSASIPETCTMDQDVRVNQGTSGLFLTKLFYFLLDHHGDLKCAAYQVIFLEKGLTCAKENVILVHRRSRGSSRWLWEVYSWVGDPPPPSPTHRHTHSPPGIFFETSFLSPYNTLIEYLKLCTGGTSKVWNLLDLLLMFFFCSFAPPSVWRSSCSWQNKAKPVKHAPFENIHSTYSFNGINECNYSQICFWCAVILSSLFMC